MNINISNKILIINVCNNIKVLIFINVKSKQIQTLIFSKSLVTISAYIIIAINVVSINVTLELFNNRDFFFESNTLNNLKIYAHIVNTDIKSVLI